MSETLESSERLIEAPASFGVHHVCVCIDGSPVSNRIMPHGLAMARALGASLAVLHVLEPQHQDGTLTSTNPLEWEMRRTDASRHLDGIILGLRRVGGRLRIDPRIPADWPGFHATIRTEGGVLQIEVENPGGSGHGVAELLVDGERIDDQEVPLPNDGKTHQVSVRLRADRRGT